jgi:hypothetical protein
MANFSNVETHQIIDPRKLDEDLEWFHKEFSALCKSRRGIDAETLLVRFVESGLPPDNFILNMILMSHHGDPVNAKRCLMEARSWLGDVPSYSAFLTVARICAEYGDVPAANYHVGLAVLRSEELTVQRCKRATREIHQLKKWMWNQWNHEQLLALGRWVERDQMFTPVDMASARALTGALGRAAGEGVMPSFAAAGARSGYTIEKMVIISIPAPFTLSSSYVMGFVS